MEKYSVYSVSDTAAPEWKPGEEQAVCGMIAITFWLFIDVNVGIYRAFGKRQGLYFWSMLLSTWSCLFAAIGLVLSLLVPHSEAKKIWPLAILFIELGWTIFAPGELLVLYSRLHLVNRNRKIQRWVLILIILGSVGTIVPSWIFYWQANDQFDQHLSALYSPRQQILARCSQLVFTFMEVIVSAIYIQSLLKLLSVKSTVRQRRVMLDLIYVVSIAVCVDMTTVILVYLNQSAISWPNQAFAYMLKLKLEFIVLNQLMAVAARGIKKQSFSERRYHYPSTSGNRKPSNSYGSKTMRQGLISSQDSGREGSMSELVVPSPTLAKDAAATPKSFSSNLLTNGRAEGAGWPKNAKVKIHGANKNGKEEDDDDEEEIGVHMWERHGKLVLEIPWFKKAEGGETTFELW